MIIPINGRGFVNLGSGLGNRMWSAMGCHYFTRRAERGGGRVRAVDFFGVRILASALDPKHLQ